MEPIAFFDRLAARWDTLNPEDLQDAAINRGLDFIEPLVGKRVLDVGCGTGILTRRILARIFDGSICALDYSPAMIATSQGKLPDSRVTWLCRDLHDNGLSADSFDVVCCYNAFPHLVDFSRTIEEFYRLLKPNGRLLIWHDIGREKLNELHKQAHASVADHLLMPVAELTALCELAGLKVAEGIEEPDFYLMLAVKPPETP